MFFSVMCNAGIAQAMESSAYGINRYAWDNPPFELLFLDNPAMVVYTSLYKYGGLMSSPSKFDCSQVRKAIGACRIVKQSVMTALTVFKNLKGTFP